MTRIKTRPAQRRFPLALTLAGAALGFGLGGFFDGILLHQILQWHHLLSGIDAIQQDLRLLVLADGLFHLLMYVITAVGLCLLWKMRRVFSVAGADRYLVAHALIGFGSWHVIDAVLSHWLLGLHRIRMDVESPLVWDLAWLAIFGIVPLIAGLVLLRSGSAGRARWAPPGLVVLCLISGAVAAVPASPSSIVMVVFRPDTSPMQAYAGLEAADGRLVWTDASQQLWAVELPGGSNGSAFYKHGALLITNSSFLAGCLQWFKASS